MKNFLAEQKKMNMISAFHPERPIRQVFRDYMLKLIMEHNDNDELYTFNLSFTPEKERELFENTYKADALKKHAKKWKEQDKKDLTAVLTKILKEKFNSCQF